MIETISKKTAIQTSVLGLILDHCPTEEKPHKTNNTASKLPPSKRGVAWPKADAGSCDPFLLLLARTAFLGSAFPTIMEWNAVWALASAYKQSKGPFNQ